jgi:ataxia telangiectasia mutated family protein
LDLENIMATRISLIRSVRQKEERQQIGILLTPFAQSLIEVEKKCLVRLSEAARDAHQIQIALNSVVRAQRLESSPSFEVSQEFASVLWIQKEEKLAVQFLKELIARDEPKMPSQNPINATQKASLLARLVRCLLNTCRPILMFSFRVPGLLKLAWKSRRIYGPLALTQPRPWLTT